MKENLFEMGAKFEESWSSDNKAQPAKQKSDAIKSPDKHRLIFAKEKRRGKVVTILRDFYMNKKQLQDLLKELKKSLGTGGTLKEDEMEFQGEVQEKLRELLSAKGFKFKN
ncbi:MAG: translation initiation factor [Campylobacterales bacterium]|nr:translation initiation factor [Campylobacterales bacterium]